MPLIASLQEREKRSNELSTCLLTSGSRPRRSHCPKHSLFAFVRVERRDVSVEARACQAWKEHIEL